MNTDIWEILIISFSFTLFLNYSTFSPVFPHRGGKYMEIHELAVNLDNLLSFSWKHLFKVPKLPKPRYPSNANSNKETKEV